MEHQGLHSGPENSLQQLVDVALVALPRRRRAPVRHSWSVPLRTTPRRARLLLQRWCPSVERAPALAMMRRRRWRPSLERTAPRRGMLLLQRRRSSVERTPALLAVRRRRRPRLERTAPRRAVRQEWRAALEWAATILVGVQDHREATLRALQ